MPNGKPSRQAGGRPAGGGALDQGRWLLLFLVIVAVIFISGRGTFREGGIRFGSPSDSGTVEESAEAPEALQPEPAPANEGTAPTESSLKGKLELSQGRASSQDPDEEHIELSASASNQTKIIIGGMMLKNSRGESFEIPEGSYLPYSGRVNPKQTIALEPGGRAFIITGRSPIGASFRTNLCTGYFAEFNEFEPRLSEDCPTPEDEPGASGLKASCLDFLETLRACRQVLEVPETDNECRNYALNEINYLKCVDNHKNDAEFYSDEWYIYLNRDAEIWKERRETITLRDRQGNIVDSLSY